MVEVDVSAAGGGKFDLSLDWTLGVNIRWAYLYATC
jgi:hypothetical protein